MTNLHASCQHHVAADRAGCAVNRCTCAVTHHGLSQALAAVAVQKASLGAPAQVHDDLLQHMPKLQISDLHARLTSDSTTR